MKLNLKTLIILITLTTISSPIKAIAQEISLTNNKPIEIAQNKQNSEEIKDNERDGKFWKTLNLTAEQKQQMKTIKQKYQPQMSSLKTQIETEREKLAKMMESNQPDNSLRSQHQKIVNLDEKKHSLKFESMLEMRAVLNPTQRKQFAQMMNEKQNNH